MRLAGFGLAGAFGIVAAHLFAVHLVAADDVPEWVRQAAAQPTSTYPVKVTSVVLLREETVNVDPDGRRVMRRREAVKVLQPGGEKPVGARAYNTKNGRVRDFQGWLLPPNGRAIPFAKNRILDVALSREYTYDETRMKVLECGDALPGSVFAWEVTDEEKTVFTQDYFAFQSESPVLLSRFVLSLPSGWEASGVVFNRKDKLEPQVSGSTYTWELKSLPWLEGEPHSPGLDARAPRLVITYFPPADNRNGLRALKDWPAVSMWVTQFVDPASEVTEPVRAKALQLTAGAVNELQKIRAIAKFVQQTNYVEVALNLTRGGGYTPRPAAETLARNYGDCKDKSALMRALLKAVGIDAYVTTIFAGERNYVRPEWASPMQFNHAIIAIRVSADVALPTVLANQELGPLLIFDPTDSITPVGDLPESEQGSYALVVAGSKGALLKMPLLPASASRVETTIDASMDASGQLDGKLARQYFGQSGAAVRAVSKLGGGGELTRRLEREWARQLGGITLANVVAAARPDENPFSIGLDLTAGHFGQIMQGRLLVVRPGTLASGGIYEFNSKQRSSPIELHQMLRHDSVKIKVPPGFKLDELPEPAKLASQYGTLDVKWTVENGEVLFERSLEVRNTMAPVSAFADIRDFFDHVNGETAAPVVFTKQ